MVPILPCFVAFWFASMSDHSQSMLILERSKRAVLLKMWLDQTAGLWIDRGRKTQPSETVMLFPNLIFHSYLPQLKNMNLLLNSFSHCSYEHIADLHTCLLDAYFFRVLPWHQKAVFLVMYIFTDSGIIGMIYVIYCMNGFLNGLFHFEMTSTRSPAPVSSRSDVCESDGERTQTPWQCGGGCAEQCAWLVCQSCDSNHEAASDPARSLSGFSSFTSQTIFGIVVSDTLIVMGRGGCQWSAWISILLRSASRDQPCDVTDRCLTSGRLWTHQEPYQWVERGALG